MDTRDFTHGGEVYALSKQLGCPADKLLDFSSNANIFARPVTEELLEKARPPFEHYPDSACAELVQAISLYEEVEAERILPGNGAADLIWLAVRALAPRKALCMGPIFSEFVKAFTAFEVPYEIITPPQTAEFQPGSEELTKIWESDADLVVLCTPNNPAALAYENMRGLFEMLRAPRVIIDNSYRDFLYGTPEYERNRLNAYQTDLRPGVSLFTLHSFTKFFCCPGIRLGYIMGDRFQISRMANLRPSWSIGSQAQHMGRLFLNNAESYRATLPALRESVRDLARQLRRTACMDADRIFEGPGFLCCGLAPGLDAGQVYQKALQAQILIRNCDTIPGMPPGFIRVRARSAGDNARLVNFLRTV